MFSASFLTSCGNSGDVSDGESTNASSDISAGESATANSDIVDNEPTDTGGSRPTGDFTVPVVVQEVPEGFILLPRVQQFENGLSFMAWNAQWSFFDIDRNNIFSTLIVNTDFIIMYEGELYINEEKFLELYEMADTTVELRSLIHELGEEIALSGGGNQSRTIVVNTIVREDVDTMAVYTIEFTLSQDRHVRDHQRRQIFYQAITENGTVIEIVFNNSSLINENTIQIQIPVDESLNTLVLRSFDVLEAVRHVSVG